MFYEIIRALIQRIFQDKILFGLVAVALLAIFVGGFGGSEKDVTSERTKQSIQGNRDNKSAENKQNSASTYSQAVKLEPSLAADFVRCWLQNSMNYNPASASKSHQEALAWMTQEAAQIFIPMFWSEPVAEAICTGKVAASFQAQEIQAIAANPDNTIVVAVKGVLHYQQGAQTSMQEVNLDLLVRREKEGLRICALQNKVPRRPGSSVY